MDNTTPVPPKTPVNIILLGEQGAGKSSMIYKYFGVEKFTIAAEFLQKELIIDGAIAKLRIWDVAMAERVTINSIGFHIYRNADACILVYDITDKKSWEMLDAWREQFITKASRLDLTNPTNLPIILVGNKTDLATARVVTYQQGQDWATSNGNIPYFESSAKDNVNLDQIFLEIARISLSYQKVHPPNIPPKPEPLQTKHSGWCEIL